MQAGYELYRVVLLLNRCCKPGYLESTFENTTLPSHAMLLLGQGQDTIIILFSPVHMHRLFCILCQLQHSVLLKQNGSACSANFPVANILVTMLHLCCAPPRAALG